MMRLVNRLIALLVIMTPLLARSQQDIPQGTGGANWSVKKIAVEAYGGETVVNLNSGSPKTPGGPPLSTALVVSGGPQSDIFVIASPNAKPKRLIEGVSPAWSPDGAKIAYCVREGRGFGQIQLINADGSGHRQLPKLKGGACLPEWSPDGQRLAVTAYSGDGTPAIVVMDKDGQNVTQMSAGYGARWSADGKRLVFCRRGEGPAAVSSIWIANADGTGLTKVIEDKSPVLEAAWWPDGQSILFTSDREHEYRSALYRVGVDGTGLENIAAEKGAALYFPVPSPDGKQIVVDVYPADFLARQREMLGLDTVGGSQVVLLDLASHQSHVLAHGKHPSVIWEKP
jgi:Tol biopolymer transport system component